PIPRGHGRAASSGHLGSELGGLVDAAGDRECDQEGLSARRVGAHEVDGGEEERASEREAYEGSDNAPDFHFAPFLPGLAARASRMASARDAGRLPSTASASVRVLQAARRNPAA